MKFFGSPWVAPNWMKTAKDSKYPNQLKGETGGEYYDIWAKYLVKYAINSYSLIYKLFTKISIIFILGF